MLTNDQIRQQKIDKAKAALAKPLRFGDREQMDALKVRGIRQIINPKPKAERPEIIQPPEWAELMNSLKTLSLNDRLGELKRLIEHAESFLVTNGLGHPDAPAMLKSLEELRMRRAEIEWGKTAQP